MLSLCLMLLWSKLFGRCLCFKITYIGVKEELRCLSSIEITDHFEEILPSKLKLFQLELVIAPDLSIVKSM